MIAVVSLLVVEALFVTAARGVSGDRAHLQAVEEQHQLVEESTEIDG